MVSYSHIYFGYDTSLEQFTSASRMSDGSRLPNQRLVDKYAGDSISEGPGQETD